MAKQFVIKTESTIRAESTIMTKSTVMAESIATRAKKLASMAVIITTAHSTIDKAIMGTSIAGIRAVDTMLTAIAKYSDHNLRQKIGTAVAESMPLAFEQQHQFTDSFTQIIERQ